MKIIISDEISAYGLYIKKMFHKDYIIQTSMIDIENYKTPFLDSTLVFVLSDKKQFPFLIQIVEQKFKNVIVCSGIIRKEHLNMEKPFEFVSLNQLKNQWLTEILVAFLKLNGKNAINLFHKDHKICKTLLSELHSKNW